ncbi:hypothetical protein [Actinomadura rudentiformis]|uniref:Uncharacterized protein n=1 Tax=Actinomadura rudentiformis TaxID=359158 RepID=A0A6H9YUJ0_9ACTN|nr:hypothetical protein [Actinomadura rudentiformis]KAB2347326.1 hypothetical protein F8566_20150 [Actinomadura rudentiformis]
MIVDVAVLYARRPRWHRTPDMPLPPDRPIVTRTYERPCEVSEVCVLADLAALTAESDPLTAARRLFAPEGK